MIKVLSPGFYTSIQDLGRFHYTEYGVPISGAMDQYASRLANAIVGNPEDMAVMEITISGPILEFEVDTKICITGAHFSPKINTIECNLNKALEIKKGDILSFGKRLYGYRCYLSISGGFKSENILGSSSMYEAITGRSKLVKNEVLVTETSQSENRKNVSVKFKDSYLRTNKIEVFKGPEFHFLSESQQEVLFKNPCTISGRNSRMAYQMEDNLGQNTLSIITSLVYPGTVQITPSGNIIVLMRDCQTTGGYPRILQLSDYALNVLAQKFTGDIIQFSVVE